MAVGVNITELGSEPIGKLLLKYATPAIIAMTASSLYNIIDAIFIGQGVGPLAIAGVSLSFPVMQVTQAFGAMVGVGAATLLSVKLGERDYENARKILGNVLILNVVMGIVIGALMMLFIDPILFFFGASQETVSYARDFMMIILAGNVFTHLYFGMNNLLRSSGKPRQAMYATIGTVVCNIILAPIFIYVFQWGIRGAAGATMLSQFLVLLWEIKLFCNPNDFLHFERRSMHLDRRIVYSALAIGLSPFLLNLCGCLVTVFFNWSLAHYGGDMEIAAFGIVNRLAFFFVMIVIGLNQAMQPIAGYNYGAQKYDRVLRTLQITVVAATVVVIVGYVMSLLFPYESVRAFTTDQDLIEKSMRAIKIMFFFFPLIGFQMVTSNFFQCIGQVRKSIFLSMTRQMLYIIPCVYFLPKHFGLDGVWYSQPVSDFLATFTSGVLLYMAVKQFKRKVN